MKVTGMREVFFRFVEERHTIWEKRQLEMLPPWTDNPILRAKKFTNVFRVLDPGSQFVFELDDPDGDPRDVLARIVLYRHTNRPTAWKAFRGDHGRYPLLSDLSLLQSFWDAYRDAGGQVFSGAYNVKPTAFTAEEGHARGADKSHLTIALTQRMFDPSSPDYVWDSFREAGSLESQFNALLATRGLGPFMALQILTDWGYTTHSPVDRENDFVAAGPGSTKGARAIYPDSNPVDAIRTLHYELSQRHTVPQLDLGNGGWREPSLMDVQNCCCEFSKYLRFIRNWTGDEKDYTYNRALAPAVKLPAHWI